MLRNERPPRWPYVLEPVSGLTGGLVASCARLPIKRQWRMSTFTRVTVAGAALGFHQLPVCTLADQRLSWTLKNGEIVAIWSTNVQYINQTKVVLRGVFLAKNAFYLNNLLQICVAFLRVDPEKFKR